MKIHLLSGFLGSGKTTAIQSAARALLQRGVKMGVIANDQGARLVDGDFFKSLGIPARQVVNGCFCCNYHDLDLRIQSLVGKNATGVIFAEAVGSCTDMVATVLKPLLKFRPGASITFTVFADVRLLRLMLDGTENSFDESVRYIYLKQLEEAAIIVINKIDLIDAVQLEYIKQLMIQKYGGKVLVFQNSLEQSGIHNWLDAVDNYKLPGDPRSLDIDYDVYARGEAKLAWLDQQLEIYSADNNALGHARRLIDDIHNRIISNGYPIGHLKFLVNGSTKVSFTPGAHRGDLTDTGPALSALLLINIRVQTSPCLIEQLVLRAIKDIEKQSGCKIIVNSLSAFQPGYPHPTHRM